MTEHDLQWSLFFRKDTKRWVLEYVPPGLTWKKAKQTTAPKNITSEPRARSWAKDKLVEIRAAGGFLSTSRKGLETLRDSHVQIMKVRAQMPDVKRSTIGNDWTHLRAQILGIETSRRPKLSDSPDAVRLREKRAKLGTKAKPKPHTDPVADLPMSMVGVTEARACVRRIRARNSPNHTRNIFSTLRMCWDVAFAEGIIATPNPFRNPLVVAEVPAAKNLHVLEGELEPITLSLAAAQALLDAPDAIIPLERRVRYCLAFTGGFDDGELAGLTWGHKRDGVSIDGGASLVAQIPFLQVRQAISLRGPAGFASLDTPKTHNRMRDVPLHPAGVAAIAEWQAAWEPLVCRKPKAKDPIFALDNGNPWRPKSAAYIRADLRAVNAYLRSLGGKAVIEDAKIDAITFKATRRTFSTMLKQKGVDAENRGRLMGHAGATVTTRNYTAHELEQLAELVARVPLRWPATLRTSLRRENGPAENGGSSTSTIAPEMLANEGEARIGIEPTYDGFAIDNPALQEAGTDAPEASAEASSAATGVRHASDDGRAQEPDLRARRGRAAPRGGHRDGAAESPQGEIGPALKKAAEGLTIERRTWDGFDEFERAVGDEEDGRG